MSTSTLPRTLRCVAIGIAAVAWLDPSLAGQGRARIAVLDRATGDLAARVRSALDARFEIVGRPDRTAGAWIVVADDEESDVPPVQTGVSLSLVTRPAGQALVLEALDVPERISPANRLTVAATFAARGLRGAESTIAVRAGRLELARTSHRWTSDDERFVARFVVLPPCSGANHLVVEAIDATTRSRRARADAVVVVDDRAIPVLVYEGRPSWTTTFARRVLEHDPRFVVSFVSRVSRGITAHSAARVGRTKTERPAALTGAAVRDFAVVVVGAPEALTAGEVTTLAAFVRTGGALVLAPDRRPEGPYLSLMANPGFRERLFDEPVAIRLSPGGGLDLLASELALPVAPPPGARALGDGTAGADRAWSLWSLASGDGQMVFVGALDAWRFRGRSGGQFDAWWPQVVEWLARSAPGELTLALDRRVVPPDTPIRLQARTTAAPESTSIHASIGRLPDKSSGDEGNAIAVRMWPAAETGTFAGTFDAPRVPGTYDVSVTVDTPVLARPVARRTLIVAEGPRQARPDGSQWRAAAATHRGVVATIDELDRVVHAIDAHGKRAQRSSPRFPMRSPWWLLPFAVCLGGEWWLRRRSGKR